MTEVAEHSLELLVIRPSFLLRGAKIRVCSTTAVDKEIKARAGGRKNDHVYAGADDVGCQVVIFISQSGETIL
jgi:hypothetical protein